MKKLNTVIAAMTLAVASTANAGQITSWTYINEAGFTGYTETKPGAVSPSGDATPNGLLGVPASTDLTWGGALNSSGTATINGGVDGLQSSFTSVSPIAGSIDTNGGPVAGTDLIHNNFVVTPKDGLLSGASFLDALQLVPTEMDGVPFDFGPLVIDAPTLGFEVEFMETVNGVNYNIATDTVTSKTLDPTIICPNGTLNGTGVNEFGCADIFAVTSDTTDFAVVGGNIEFSGSFVLDGYQYTITTILSGLELITDAACSAVGLDDGCFGFLTAEEQQNVLTAEFRVDSRLITVSAPATIALLGLGLMGLGGLARRKQK